MEVYLTSYMAYITGHHVVIFTTIIISVWSNNIVAHGFAFVNISVITYSLVQIHIYLEAVGIVGLQLSILPT